MLEREDIRHLHHNLFQTQRLIEWVKFFDTNNIKVLPFKGPALALLSQMVETAVLAAFMQPAACAGKF